MYVAVYVWKGIVDRIDTAEDLEKLKKIVIAAGNGGFDPATDELKIFDSEKPDVCIFSYECHLREQLFWKIRDLAIENAPDEEYMEEDPDTQEEYHAVCAMTEYTEENLNLVASFLGLWFPDDGEKETQSYIRNLLDQA